MAASFNPISGRALLPLRQVRLKLLQLRADRPAIAAAARIAALGHRSRHQPDRRNGDDREREEGLDLGSHVSSRARARLGKQ